jgi:hypothetical protein
VKDLETRGECCDGNMYLARFSEWKVQRTSSEEKDQEEKGGTRRDQEGPKGTRRDQEGPGGTKLEQEVPGGTTKPGREKGGDQKGPGGTSSSKRPSTVSFGLSKNYKCIQIQGSPISTMVPVSTVQPSLNEAVGLQIFFHHSDILSCITFYIK